MQIKIRELDISDINFILEIENNKDIWKVSHTTSEFTKNEIEQFIAKNIIEGLNNEQKRWLITANNDACGCIDIFDYDKQNQRAGVGIVIHKDFQNKNIATKALKKFIKYCKKELKINQLYCSIIPDNIYSIQLFTKLGFKETGIRKEWTLYDGKWYDEIFYQLKL